jgi:hypothetical protein
MTVYVYSHRQTAYMTGISLNIDRENCGQATETCRAYPQRVYLPEKFPLQR